MKVPASKSIKMHGTLIASEIVRNEFGASLRLSFSFGFGCEQTSCISLPITHSDRNLECIGQKMMSKISTHCGVMQLKDTSQLHGKTFPLTIIQIEREAPFEPELVLLSVF